MACQSVRKAFDVAMFNKTEKKTTSILVPAKLIVKKYIKNVEVYIFAANQTSNKSQKNCGKYLCIGREEENVTPFC